MSNILHLPFAKEMIIISEKSNSEREIFIVPSTQVTTNIGSEKIFDDGRVVNDPYPQIPIIELHDPFRLF